MSEIYGDISGIRKTVLEKLKQLYQVSPDNQPLTEEMAAIVAQITTQINREIALLINRHGQVIHIAVGDFRTVSLPPNNLDCKTSKHRLSGIRCVHTHPGGNSTLSDADISLLKTMRLDLIAALGVADSQVKSVSFSYITSCLEDDYAVATIDGISINEFCQIDFSFFMRQIEQQIGHLKKSTVLTTHERALLVGVDFGKGWDIGESLEELAQLAETAGAEVMATVWQKRERPDSAFFIGRGKVQDVSLIKQAKKANIIIFDDELSPAQQRNLETALGVKVLDRTALILDIFAQRAKSHEGKLQVELAQLRYNLPRLGGQGLVLSRLGGGIGTRGPGETKLEVDKRRLRARINEIEKEIENIKSQRELRRKQRKQSRIPSVALVGYTNAGKSTLLNALTAANVIAEDKLFATLDPTTRRLTLPNGQDILLTDTVGFIQKLPHQLVAAFRASLEEVVQSDLLLHVIDAGHALYQAQKEAVFDVLRELNVDSKRILTVYNKIDRLENSYAAQRMLREENSIAISALTGKNINTLLSALIDAFSTKTNLVKIQIPYSESGILAALYDQGMVHSVEYETDGVLVTTTLPAESAQYFQEYIVGDE